MAFADDVERVRDLRNQLVDSGCSATITRLVNNEDFTEDEIQELQVACVDLIQIVEQLNNIAVHMEESLDRYGDFVSEPVGSIYVLKEIVSDLRDCAAVCREQCHNPAELKGTNEFGRLENETDNFTSYVTEPRFAYLESAAHGDFSADSAQIEKRNAALLKEVDDRTPFTFWTANGYLFIDPDNDQRSFPGFFTENADRGTAIVKRARVGAGKIEVTEGNAAYLEYGISNFSDKKVVDAGGGEDEDDE